MSPFIRPDGMRINGPRVYRDALRPGCGYSADHIRLLHDEDTPATARWPSAEV